VKGETDMVSYSGMTDREMLRASDLAEEVIARLTKSRSILQNQIDELNQRGLIRVSSVDEILEPYLELKRAFDNHDLNTLERKKDFINFILNNQVDIINGLSRIPTLGGKDIQSCMAIIQALYK
jgi:hypothetical protein